jgi:hypothetical protein
LLCFESTKKFTLKLNCHYDLTGRWDLRNDWVFLSGLMMLSCASFLVCSAPASLSSQKTLTRFGALILDLPAYRTTKLLIAYNLLSVPFWYNSRKVKQQTEVTAETDKGKRYPYHSPYWNVLPVFNLWVLMPEIVKRQGFSKYTICSYQAWHLKFLTGLRFFFFW